jgi:ankyrin repeat protein
MEEVRFVLPTRAVVRALVFEGEAPPSLKELRALAAGVLSGGPSHFGKGPPTGSSLTVTTTVDLTALDEDGDDVLLTCDADVVAVFAAARAFGVAPRFGVPAAVEYSAPNMHEFNGIMQTAIKSNQPSAARAQVLKIAGVERMDRAAVWAPGVVPWAAQRQREPAILRFLLARGADVNGKGDDGSTAMHIAVIDQNADVIKILLDAGADVNAVDSTGRTPLFILTLYFSSHSPPLSSLVRLLLDRGADVNALDKDGQTPLLLAVSQLFATAGRGAATPSPLLRLLLASGADLNRRGASSTPLHIAVEKGDEAMAAMLLDAGANASAVDAKGRAPLHVAFSAANVSDSLVRQLVARGADVNARMGGKSVLALLRANASYMQRGQAVPYGGYSGPQPLQTLDEYLVSKGARVT